MEKRPLNIIVTGPESSGKTTLTLNLAFHFKCTWNAEVARSYLEAINRPYTQEDVLAIAKLQLNNLDVVKANGLPIHIFDTSLLVIKVWLQEKYNTTVTWIEEALRIPTNDLYVLCKPDMAWEADPFRENEYDRDRLFVIYELALKKLEKEYLVVEGSVEDRVVAVAKHVDMLL